MIIGVVAAKKDSIRFKDKNIYKIEGVPLFWHSVQPMIDSELVNKVYVATDSEYIMDYCHNEGGYIFNRRKPNYPSSKVVVMWRHPNASRSDDKLINIIRYVYYSIPESCHIVVRIMANCPGHTAESVDATINLMRRKNLKEVRSFNKK